MSSSTWWHRFPRIRTPRNSATPVDETPLCPTCSALSITNILRDGLSKENRILLGSLVDILHRADQCRFCHLVASLLRRRWCLDTLPNVNITGVDCSLYATSAGTLTLPRPKERKQCHRLDIDFSHRPTEVSDALFLAHKDLYLDIQLLEEDAHKVRRAKEVHGRRVGDTVDMELVKAWIALCEREHGSVCDSIWWRGSKLRLPPFVRMVDVIQMSVVPAPPDCRYVALSYVWGTAGDTYWTTSANIGSRAQPASLNQRVLPATIMDSIHVTQALSERYLWIDALCIIQDNTSDKDDQIRVMDLIYSQALLTIVAAGGRSAEAGLPGFSSSSRPTSQHIEVIQGLHLAIPLPSLRDALSQTVWDTRGWTFQELLLSRRRLFFTHHQVYFECTKDVWCEDLVAESKTSLYTGHPMSYLGSIAPSFFGNKPPAHPEAYCIMAYNHFVEEYTRRHLTYPSDIIHAVTALTGAIAKAYQSAIGGNITQAFRYGMLVWELEYSLLWQPRLDSLHTRRVSSYTGDPPWPSWSWAGWIGATYYSGPQQLMSDTISSTAQQRVEESLVAGWYIVDEHQLIPLDVKKIAFRLGIDATRPRYRVPEGDIDEQQLQPLPHAGTLIFRTQVASFTVSKLREISSDSSPKFPHAVFRILSDVRQPSACVGRIILPSSTPSPTVLKVVMLSRGGEMLEFYDESLYGKSYYACLLHVMAVRGNGNDARVQERVGLGAIFEQAWIECNPGVETVFLS